MGSCSSPQRHSGKPSVDAIVVGPCSPETPQRWRADQPTNSPSGPLYAARIHASNNTGNENVALVTVQFRGKHLDIEFIPQELSPNRSRLVRLLPPRRVHVPYEDVDSWSYTESTFRLRYLSGAHVNQLNLSTDQARSAQQCRSSDPVLDLAGSVHSRAAAAGL